MNELKILIKNELKNLVTNNIFLMSFAIFFISLVGSTYAQIEIFLRNIALLDYYGMLVDNIWMELGQNVISRQVGVISSIGALVAGSISFNTIEASKTEGSLKILLSYPVYRDKVIFSKIIAGITIIGLIVIASLSLSYALFLFYCNIPLTTDLLIRLLSITFMSIIILSFYLVLGLTLSLFLNNVSSNLLVLFMIIRIFQPESINLILISIGSVLSNYNLLHAQSSEILYIVDAFQSFIFNNSFTRKYGRISPIEAYRQFSLNIFTYPSSLITSYFDLFSSQSNPGSALYILAHNIDLIAIQFFYLIIASSTCYVLFTRRDIE